MTQFTSIGVDMKNKTYTYHANSRVARYFAEKRGGKYIGFMGDLELQLEIIKVCIKNLKI